MVAETQQSILVLDADFRFLDSLKKDPKNDKHPVVTTSDGKKAQLHISDRNNGLAGIFVNPNVRFEPNWLSVVRCSFMNRPTVPIHVILDKDKSIELTPEELRRLGVKDTIKKPMSYSQMVEMVSPIALGFDARVALAKAKELEAKSPSDLTQDSAYIAIRAEDFLSGTNSIFDVFIRLGASKYVKLLTAGDSFTLDRVENFIKKGVTHLYIRKEVQEVYLNYCDHLATALVKSDVAPQEFKMSQVMNQGDEVMKHLMANGVSEANIKYATKFVSNVRLLADQVVAADNGYLRGFTKNVALYEHGVATAMLAGMLANAMELCSEKPVEIVGMAALFHDSALSTMPEKFWTEDESQMTPEERALYRKHPEIAAENLRKISKFDVMAATAISEHHMRLGSRGFPERTGTTIMSRVSEIIGICDDAAKMIVRAEKDSNYKLFHELEIQVFPSFSRQVVMAFKSVFFPKHSEGSFSKAGTA